MVTGFEKLVTLTPLLVAVKFKGVPMILLTPALDTGTVMFDRVNVVWATLTMVEPVTALGGTTTWTDGEDDWVGLKLTVPPKDWEAVFELDSDGAEVELPPPRLGCSSGTGSSMIGILITYSKVETSEGVSPLHPTALMVWDVKTSIGVE